MRNEIVCPKCGTPIQIDDVTRDSIVKQVRDNEFAAEVERQKESLKTQMESELRAAQAGAKLEMKDEIEKRDAEILSLNKAKEHAINEATKAIFERDRKYNKLKDETDKTIAELQKKVDLNQVNLESAVSNAVNQERQNSHEKDIKIVQLTEEVKQNRVSAEANLSKMKNEYEANILKLQNDIANLKNVHLASEQSMKEKYDLMLRAKDEEIEYHKFFKKQLSVKLIGESLEEHCSNEFNSVRAFLPPYAQFDKDNVISPETRSKGDYIFRECDENGVEMISIMFEMKNEADDSIHKHKNEDYFKELDKDRIEKKCEYAVLVSMLEPESETYNRGIVDVSHVYQKMYVIRPQFFIPLLTILRNAALNTLEVKEELERLKNQNIDVTTFESDLEGYKDAIAKCFEQASKKKESAVNNIDKAIALLQKVRDDLTKYETHEEQAAKKANGLTIKKLTKNAPAVARMIEESVMTVEEADYEEGQLLDDGEIECIPDYNEVDIPYIPTDEEIDSMMQEAYAVDVGFFEDE